MSSQHAPFDISSGNTVIHEGPIVDKDGNPTGEYLSIYAPTEDCRIPKGEEGVCVDAIMLRGTSDDDAVHDLVICKLGRDGNVEVGYFHFRLNFKNACLREIK